MEPVEPRPPVPPFTLDTAEENVPALGLYRALGFRSGGDEPGRLAVFMRRRIDENVPPGWG